MTLDVGFLFLSDDSSTMVGLSSSGLLSALFDGENTSLSLMEDALSKSNFLSLFPRRGGRCAPCSGVFGGAIGLKSLTRPWFGAIGPFTRFLIEFTNAGLDELDHCPIFLVGEFDLLLVGLLAALLPYELALARGGGEGRLGMELGKGGSKLDCFVDLIDGNTIPPWDCSDDTSLVSFNDPLTPSVSNSFSSFSNNGFVTSEIIDSF